MELEEFARLESQLSSLDTELISIQPELERYTADQVRQRELKFRILTDLDLAYALQVGLVCWVGDEVNDIYKARGIDLAGFHGSNGQFLPVPATFVLTKQGTVSARHVDPDFRRRMEPAHLLECVRAAWDAGLRHSG
jgi:peroxiredoxin